MGQAIVPAAGFPAGARFAQIPAAWKGGCRHDCLPHASAEFCKSRYSAASRNLRVKIQHPTARPSRKCLL